MSVLRRITPFLVAGLMLTVSGRAQAVTVYSERLMPFDIGANIDTKGDVWNAIRRYGPSEYSTGQMIIGQANWRIGYSYRIRKSGVGLCMLHEPKVEVKVIINIPKWDFRARARQDAQDFFACVRRTVELHEYWHGDIARKTGERVHDALSRQLNNTSCDGFKARAKQIYNRVYQQGIAEQAAFDKADYARNRYQACWDDPLNAGRGGQRMSRRWTSVSPADYRRYVARREEERAYEKRRAQEPAPVRTASTRSQPSTRAVTPPRRTPARSQPRHAPEDNVKMLSTSSFVALAAILALLGGGFFLFKRQLNVQASGAATTAGSDWTQSAMTALETQGHATAGADPSARAQHTPAPEPRTNRRPPTTGGFGKRKPGPKR